MSVITSLSDTVDLTQETLDARTLNRRGIARLQRGDVAGALEHFRQAGLLQADFAEPWNNAGLVRQMLGKLKEAIADFDRALAIRRDYPEALTNRGRARQALGDFEGALADYDRALECAAGTFVAAVLHNRGTLRQDREDWAGALADFDRALEINPELTATLVSRGAVRKELGDLDGAIVDFDRALAEKPTRGLAAIYHGRGGIRALRNDFAGAMADYDEALRLAPEQFHIYISRGNARYHRRDPRAVLDFRMAFRLDPEAAAREFLRILTNDAKRQPEAVLENCDKHLRINERDLIATARRGFTLLLLGREAEAAPDLERVQEMLPDMRGCLQRLIALTGNRLGFKQAAPAHGHPLAARHQAMDAVFAGFG